MSLRFLTDQEIRDVLQHIPQVICADKRERGLAYMVREQQLDVLTSVLRTVPVREEAIPDLGPEIAKYWKRAVIDPGTAVGTLASQAVGEPATQGKLKNFSSTGTIRARSYNADRIDEVLTVVSTQRFRNMMIVFQNKNITYEQVLQEFRPKIVGMTLKKLVKDFEVLSTEDPAFPEVDTHWWSLYSYIYGVNIASLSSVFLRLRLDVKKMGAYRITLPMVADAIRSGDNKSFIAVIHSPFNIGIMDVFVMPGAEVPLKGSRKSLNFDPKDVNTFIDNVLIPAVTGETKDEHEIQISGIKGIVDMIPVEVKIVSLISKVLDRSNDIYDVYVNVKQEALLGIPRDRIKQALKAVGCRIVKIPENELHYTKALPLFIRCQAPKDPYKLLEEHYDALVLSLPNETKVRDYNNPKYHQLTYIYAETEGNNLRDVLSIPGIDKNHTISNDLREVRDVLGIQAARNFIVQEIMTVIETLGTRIHQSHVMIIADCIARNHNLLPVNHLGTIKNLGPFTNMAFERAGETVLRASKGEIENVSSVSSQVGTGRTIISGTGAIDVFDAPPEPEIIVPTLLGKASLPVTNVPIPGTGIGTASASSNPVNPVLNAVTNTINVSSSISDILRRRQQLVSGIIATTQAPTSCPRVADTVQYIFSTADIPVPLVINHRTDLFATIAESIGLFGEVTVTTTYITPLTRTTLPLLRQAAASSLQKK